MSQTKVKSKGHTCFRCAKQIKGTMVYVVPPLLMVRLCGDFEKAFHPKCYEVSETEAGEELMQYKK